MEFLNFDVESVTERAMTLLPNVISAIFVLIAFAILFRVTRGTIRSALVRAGLHSALVRLLVDNIFRMVMIVFSIVMALDQLGVDVAAALAGLGIAGIAIGFAAQDTLSNILAGLMIFWDKPFEQDDWVTVAGQYGQVQEITMRSTRIRTRDNTYVVIPNRTIIDEVLVNHSKHGATRVAVPIGIAYKENVPQARTVLLESVRDLPGVADEPAPDVVVQELGDSSVNLQLRVWILSAETEQPVFNAVLEAGKLALDGAGIEIPFPHMQLFVENVEDRVWQKAAGLARGTAG